MINYFEYLPAPRRGSPWGNWMTSCGYTCLPSGAVYPPSTPRHPRHHDFSWAAGRVLDALQIVWIESGTGTLELAGQRKRKLIGPCVFLLLPGQWHRYRPASRTGWTEHWIEIDGPAVKDILKMKNHSRQIFSTVSAKAWTGYFGSLHTLVTMGGRAVGLQGSLLGMQMLMQLLFPTPHAQQAHPDDRILKAERWMEEGSTVPQILRRLGMSYSHFRRSFREYAGVAPRQYLLQLRHRAACGRLRDSAQTLQQIAEELNYHSAFHFSSDFKRRTGLSPSKWRERVRRVSPN